MSTQPKVAIILLNYMNYQQTIDCINSIQKITYSNYIIIVVDNNSCNESYKKLSAYTSNRVFLLNSGANGGFAFGNNVGIEFARKFECDFFLLLNNDTLVKPDFLNTMIDVAQSSTDIGITTCRIMYSGNPDKVWYAGGHVDWDNARAVHDHYNYTPCDTDSIREVDFVSGCCMLISNKCIKEAGLLPEDYFMYYEDLDYCVHVRNLGFKLMYVPESKIYHCVSAASGGSESPFIVEWTNRSRRKFMRKYRNKYSTAHYFQVYFRCEIRNFIKIIIHRKRIEKVYAYIRSLSK